MGNSATKEHRGSSSAAGQQNISGGPNPDDSYEAWLARGPQARHDAAMRGSAGPGNPAQEPRRETRQERDARRAQRERAARLKERERSLREESVDGGYLVTLGTYTGPEDFSKTTVRQLMLERRIAPFWRGLNEHSTSWTEYQLVAAARGLPIPAPDEIPPELTPQQEQHPPLSSNPIPIRPTGHTPTPNTYQSSSLSTLSHNHASSTPTAASPLFRGRSKTLASLSSKNDSQTELVPQEIRLAHEPYINGQPVEANLYKDVLECPICFLYYPPYLNRTRCCDQPICSECFVQIKRPNPHPPEHLDPNSPVPEDIRRQEEEGQLVSEPAACPFCVQTEFGVTYEAPPFRRGLAYANNNFSKNASTMASSPSMNGTGITHRRRGQSISATAPGVITTDRVRPDWAKKLSDARAQAARRSAAATALHTAAYTLGGNAPRLGFGRRRRNFMIDVTGGDGSGRPEGMPIPNVEMLMAALSEQSSSQNARLGPGSTPMMRSGSRQSRTDELEELMMMEAIRQSLAAEEERKRREEKEAAKQAKKDGKQKAKDQKKADKAAKKGGLYTSSSNASAISPSPPSSPGQSTIEEGKGKQKAEPSNAALLGFNPLSEPTSTLNTEVADAGGERVDQCVHTEPTMSDFQRARGISSASSSASSVQEATDNGGGSLLNFGSLVAMMDESRADPESHDEAEESSPKGNEDQMGNDGDNSGVVPKETGAQLNTDGNGTQIHQGRFDLKNYEASTHLKSSTGKQTTQ